MTDPTADLLPIGLEDRLPAAARALTRARRAGLDAMDTHGYDRVIPPLVENGNAVAMTTTIESGFGSRLWAAGFLLNNELTDFSFRPADAKGRPIANAVAGGKRPRSSMAPTIVLDANGDLISSYTQLADDGSPLIEDPDFRRKVTEIEVELQALPLAATWTSRPQNCATT